jgi:NADPH-dependent curcumin reductase CurA
MSDSKNRQWTLAARPTGNLTGNEFRWNEAPIPQPADGQVLVRNLWLSFDPTQRGWMARDSYLPMIPLGEVMHQGVFRGESEVTEGIRGIFR